MKNTVGKCPYNITGKRERNNMNDYKYCIGLKKRFPFIRIYKKRLGTIERIHKQYLKYMNIFPVVCVIYTSVLIYVSLKQIITGKEGKDLQS